MVLLAVLLAQHAPGANETAATADKADRTSDDSYHGRCVWQALTPYGAASTAFCCTRVTFV